MPKHLLTRAALILIAARVGLGPTRLAPAQPDVIVPLGVATRLVEESDPTKREQARTEDERTWTGVFKLRVALPGTFGDLLTATVQALRTLPDERFLGQQDVGAAVGSPGGPGWPGWDDSTHATLPEVTVTLRRLAAESDDLKAKLGNLYDLYESKETIVLVADPRARHAYTRQQAGGGSREAGATTAASGVGGGTPAARHPAPASASVSEPGADEATQCRRCDWPTFLPQGASVKELLAGGAYVRAFLAPDESKPDDDPARMATAAAVAFFADHQDAYPAPYGVAELPAWADDVPSPIQVSQAEPAQNPAFWSPGEAGVSVSLTSGDALLATTDFAWQGRMLGVTLDRTYRSGTLGYGPLGSAGWHGSLFAHLRELATTGEVEYHDGQGNVYRFIPRTATKPDGYDDDPSGSYFVPRGLFLRLVKFTGGKGWRLYGAQHDSLIFDAAGRLVRERRVQTGIGWVETRTAYNERDQVTSTTQTGLAGDAPGALIEGTTTATFDPYGRVSTTTSPAGIVTTTSYDSAGRIAGTQTGASGARQRGYDALSRLVFTTDGDQGTWRGAYDAWGRLAQETQPSGAVIEREYDKAGGITRESVFADPTKAAKLAETTFTTTSFGAVSEGRELISGGGSPNTTLVTTHTFDGTGRIVETRRGPSGSQRLEQHLDYEPGTGRTLASTDAMGNQTSYVYSGSLPWASKIIATEPASGSQPAITLTTTPSYDALGRVIREDRAGTIIDRAFDEAGNVLSSSTGGANQLLTTYDSRGLARSIAKPEIGGLVASGYDPDGRLLATNVTREGGAIEAMSYHYDASGRMDHRTRPGSLPESFTYNPDDTLATWTTRLANTSGSQLVLTHTYDAANRLTSRGPANPQDFDDAHRPAGLAAPDGGDVMTYDPLGRLASSGILPQPGAASPDPASLVTYADFDTRGLPKTERVGFWPAGSMLERHYDAFGNTTATLLPQGIAGSPGFAGHAASFDALDRMTSVTQANADGSPVAGASFGATLSWSGGARPIGVTTPSGLATSQGFDPATGRLVSLNVNAGSTALGQMAYGWDVPRDLKSGRAVLPPPASGLPAVFSGLGYAARYDGVQRMTGAETGRGNLAGGTTQGTPLGSWTYSYGKADELVSIMEATGGVQQYASGPEGRITTRTGPDGSEPFAYDGEGRRTEDAASRYIWDWRGRIVQVDPKAGDHAGERIGYSYDATGRLLSRTNLGQVPQGGTDNDRPFIAKRAFIWDGQRLAAEAGLNFSDQPIWRQQYAPGQRGLDDAPLVQVESDLQGTPITKTYALLRDEMGTVTAVAEERAGQSPNLLARYLYAPYGQRHTELGPELVRIAFDATITKVGTTNQNPTANQSVAGALRIVTTSPLAATSLTNGLTIERYDQGSSSWQAAPRTDFAIGAADDDPTDLRVMRIAGWAKATRYRITLLPSITDSFGRALILPSNESQGLAVELDVPTDGITAPNFARAFTLAYDKGASDTLGGNFPGGQTLLFQGAWTDPITGLGFHRARWVDRTNAAWLSGDPLGAIDSTNLYAFAVGRPTMGIDPEGLYEKDFHFYAVYYLARAAGFWGDDARMLAWASQYVDDNPGTSPDPSLEFAAHYSRSLETLRAFHFLSPLGDPVQRGNPLALMNVERARHLPGLIGLGIALHGWADTFSHESFVGMHDPRNKREGSILRPNIGHADAPEGGHYPDEPYRDVGKAMQAARSTYEILRVTAEERGYTRYGRFAGARTWEQIATTIETQFRIDASLPRRVESWHGAILAAFGESVDYDTMLVPGSWRSVFAGRAAEQRRFVLGQEAIAGESGR